MDETRALPRSPVMPVRSRIGTLFLGASLVLIALNMRTIITSVGPVLPEAMRDAGLSPGGAGFLTTMASICFGLFGPLAPTLARRLGTERIVLAALVIAALGTALRGGASAAALFCGQILGAGGIGIINVLMPGLVKRDFPQRAALMTGLYTMAICLGAAIAAGATVPISHLMGGNWAIALAFWGAPLAVAAAVWTAQLGPGARQGSAPPFRVRGLLTDPLAWQVTLFVGLQASLAYICMGWVAPILRDRGLDPVEAGLALSLSILTQAPSALIVPSLAVKSRDQRLPNVLVIVGCATALMGCLYAPLSTVWLWTTLMGVCLGGTLSLAMMMLVLRAPDGHVAAQLSSMAQGIGYLLAAAGPFLAGALKGWTGGWGATAILVVAIAVAASVFGYAAGRARHVGAVTLYGRR